MKADSIKFANAFGLAIVILWAACAAFVFLFPELSRQIMSWWSHGMIAAESRGYVTVEGFLFGGFTVVVSAWVSGWVLGWSWNMVGGNRKK